MRSIPLSYYRQQFEGFGYGLYTDVVDDMGRRWRYCTAPIIGPGGSSGYFNDKAGLDEYLERVRIAREV